MTKLSELLCRAGIEIPKKYIDSDIVGVVGDSRKARAGTIFVCVTGAVTDGHIYARAAYDRGCRVFVCERTPAGLPRSALIIRVKDSRAALTDLAAELYGHPERELRLVGITGTKGKTTTAMLVKKILGACGTPCGYIGSNGIDFADFHFDSVNTTPQGCEIYEYLRKMSDSGVKTAVLEVSSQALYMSRVRGLKFDVCVFTNFSRDHIGGHEHPDMEHYKNCKKLLFSKHCDGTAIFNADDPTAQEFAASAKCEKIKYFSLDRRADFTADNIRLCRSSVGPGSEFTLTAGRQTHKSAVNFPGGFSVSNALAAAAVCSELGVGLAEIAAALPSCYIEGRFETVSNDGVDYIIDYAHNGASLRSALSALREYSPRRLICLFGSVGGRTQLRRSELGAAAAELSDFSIITSDNPDCEPPLRIIDDIAREFAEADSYIEIPDRREAIEYAVRIAKPGDIVLLAGKGHERYQLINGSPVPFCEREILQKAFSAATV